MDEYEKDAYKRHFQDSQHILYAVFRYRKDHTQESVAKKIKMSKNTLKNYIEGRTAAPVEVIKKIYAETRHPLIKELLEPEGFELKPKKNCKIELLPTIDHHIVQALGKIVDLERAFKKYFEDKKIDAHELQDLQVLKGQAQDAINTLFRKIETTADQKVRAA